MGAALRSEGGMTVDELKDWLRTFGRVAVRPLPSTFLTEAEKAKGKFGGAVGWLAFVLSLMNTVPGIL